MAEAHGDLTSQAELFPPEKSCRHANSWGHPERTSLGDRVLTKVVASTLITKVRFSWNPDPRARNTAGALFMLADDRVHSAAE